MPRIFCSFLLVNLLTACSYELNKNVNFKLNYQGSVQECEDLADGLMFYLSAFSTDKAQSLEPALYRSEQVALIGADCTDGAWQVALQQGVKEGETLHFELGVPFALNHANPLTAKAPLNVSEMFWSWQLGHKFLRLDQVNGFSFHLGSTGCSSPSKLRPATQACKYPNRYKFSIENYQVDKPVIFDLDALLNGVDKSQSCMSDNANPSCQSLYSNLTKKLFYQE